MIYLLDSNLLIALVVSDHVHHDAADRWFASHKDPFATCPITQGSLVRFLVREGQPVAIAVEALASLVAHRRHSFWADDVSFTDVALGGVVGHRQVTDAYLAQLARSQQGSLATLDEGLAAAHPDVVELVGSS